MIDNNDTHRRSSSSFSALTASAAFRFTLGRSVRLALGATEGGAGAEAEVGAGAAEGGTGAAAASPSVFVSPALTVSPGAGAEGGRAGGGEVGMIGRRVVRRQYVRASIRPILAVLG